jgi:hypothetical protein
MNQTLVAHACNLSYCGVKYKEYHGLRPTHGKRFMRRHLNQQMGAVVHTCHLISAGG